MFNQWFFNSNLVSLHSFHLKLLTNLGHDEIVELLVNVHDADINASNSIGETPFHTASKNGNYFEMQCTFDSTEHWRIGIPFEKRENSIIF